MSLKSKLHSKTFIMPESEAKPNDIKLRWYQDEAADKLIEYFDINDGHPIVVVPTAGGKTIILSEFINRYMTDYPGSKVLVLSHVKEILQQDLDAITDYFHGYECGLWSAGLNSKTKKSITVAGIQSVYKNHRQFSDINIVIVDECHLINPEQQGMYRTFLSKLDLANYVGLTATPFRLGHGYIHEGDNALFTDIVYDLSSVKNFNRLVSEGYLSEMISKVTDSKWSVDDIRTRAGDFREDDLSVKFDRDEITEEAVNEIIKYGKNYKCWLVFAIDINHAEHIAKKMSERGIKTACIHSKMEKDRSKVIQDIKDGIYRCTVNVNVLTTGFDVPQIDLIAMLRPTQSPVLHVQSIGRGLRVVHEPGFLDTIEGRNQAIQAGPKQHCLVLDFAHNIERLGPINNVQIKPKGKGKAIVKICPDCQAYNYAAASECKICGYKFPQPEKRESSPGIYKNSGTSDVVQRSVSPKWHTVSNITYNIHHKKGKPSSLRVSYQCDLQTFREWVCIDHPPGFAKHRAKNWVRFRLAGVLPPDKHPTNLQELYAVRDMLKAPTKIKVDKSTSFPNIIDSIFH